MQKPVASGGLRKEFWYTLCIGLMTRALTWAAILIGGPGPVSPLFTFCRLAMIGGRL